MMTYEWCKHFKNGSTSTDDEGSGQPSTSRCVPLIAQVKNIIHGNRLLTVQEAAEEVEMSSGSCHTVLMEGFNMQRLSAKFLPRLLTDDQKLQQFSICEYLLQTSLPVTEGGCTVMTLTPNNSHHTERVLLCFAPRKQDSRTRQ
jgi:hypothetical protein